MKKAIKWILISGGGLLALIIVALLIAPFFVDVQKYKPEIEKRVAEATGRPFNIGGDLQLSLFPWTGLAFSDLHLGSPHGFKEKDLLSVKSFEARIKLLPLLSRDVQVKRFILEGPRIFLEKNKEGRGNWEGIGKPSRNVPPKPKKKEEMPPEGKPWEGLPVKAVAVGEFTITEGSVRWIDHAKGERREISDVTIRLRDVSLDSPIHLAFSAMLDGQALSLEGNVGPVGKDPGKGTVPLDLVVNVLKQLEMSLKGKVVDPASRPQFKLALHVSPFSPKKLMAALDKTLTMTTADPEALNRVSLKAKLEGSPQDVSVSDGIMSLDESRLDFSIKAKDFSKPNVTFNLDMDKIDLDRYLSPPGEDKTTQEKSGTKVPPPDQKKTEYAPLRNLVLDGSIRVANLKAQGAKIQNLNMKVFGKNGLIRLDPLTLNLYQGDVSVKGKLDVRQNTPKSDMELHVKGTQIGPLLRDILKKEPLEGNTNADIFLRMEGDDAERIKRTLNGKGDFVVKDGALVGIDLAGMVRNVKTAFGLAEKEVGRPRTDFSELHSPFTITDGVVDTPGTSLISPILRVTAVGKADLVKDALDFRLVPTFVATLKGQGDTMQRSGIEVPVLVTGRFSSPAFRPDLKGMLTKGIKKKVPQASELEKMLPGRSKQDGGTKSLKEGAKDLLKGLEPKAP